MHIFGPSSAALIENVTQESVDQACIWCTLLYGENEEKGRLWDPFSLLKGAVTALHYSATCNIHLEYAVSWKNEPFVLHSPDPTPALLCEDFWAHFTIFGRKFIPRTSFCLPLKPFISACNSHQFWNRDGFKFQQKWGSLLPLLTHVSQQLSSQEMDNSSGCRTLFHFQIQM